jgi:hypothetical protein
MVPCCSSSTRQHLQSLKTGQFTRFPILDSPLFKAAFQQWPLIKCCGALEGGRVFAGNGGVESDDVDLGARQIKQDRVATGGPEALSFDAERFAKIAQGETQICERLCVVHIGPQRARPPLTLDGTAVTQGQQSEEPLIINKRSSGPHNILVEMVNPTHKVIEGKTITFQVP